MFAPALPSAMNCPTAHFRPSASRAEPTESADVQIPRAFNLGLGGGIYALMRKPANRKLVSGVVGEDRPYLYTPRGRGQGMGFRVGGTPVGTPRFPPSIGTVRGSRETARCWL